VRSRNHGKGWEALSRARNEFISGSIISVVEGGASFLTLLGLAFLNIAFYKNHKAFQEEHNAFVTLLDLHLLMEEVPGPNHDELLVSTSVSILEES